MIGNETDAKAALDAAMGSCANLYSDNGSTRQVYLINNVIYKIDRYGEDNAEEWRRYCSIAPALLPPFIRLPEMSLFTIGDEKIIAAEFIQGNEMGDCWEANLNGKCECPPGLCLDPKVSEDIMGHCDISDLAIGNVILSNDIYYVIDLGC